ncbi:hypothetical protein STEG23_002701, partial [Scotinomys teguina]
TGKIIDKQMAVFANVCYDPYKCPVFDYQKGHTELSNLGLTEWLPKRKVARRTAIKKVVTREYTINIHKCIEGVGFKKRVSRELKEIWKFAMKEMETPDVCIDTRPNKAV